MEGATAINGIPIMVEMAEMMARLQTPAPLGAGWASNVVKPPQNVIERFRMHPRGL